MMVNKLYAVCYETSEGDEIISRVENTVEDALLWLGRYAVYRSYGNLSPDSFLSLVAVLDRLRAEKTLDQMVALGGVGFYVRELSEEEALGIISEQ